MTWTSCAGFTDLPRNACWTFKKCVPQAQVVLTTLRVLSHLFRHCLRYDPASGMLAGACGHAATALFQQVCRTPGQRSAGDAWVNEEVVPCGNCAGRLSRLPVQQTQGACGRGQRQEVPYTGKVSV